MNEKNVGKKQLDNLEEALEHIVNLWMINRRSINSLWEEHFLYGELFATIYEDIEHLISPGCHVKIAAIIERYEAMDKK